MSDLTAIWELSLVCLSLCKYAYFNLKENNFILLLIPPLREKKTVLIERERKGKIIRLKEMENVFKGKEWERKVDCMKKFKKKGRLYY